MVKEADAWSHTAGIQNPHSASYSWDTSQASSLQRRFLHCRENASVPLTGSWRVAYLRCPERALAKNKRRMVVVVV